MVPGDVIYGSGLAGTFTLPRDRNEKLAFIAGGIGVTPFRSMIQDLVDRTGCSLDRPALRQQQGRRDRLLRCLRPGSRNSASSTVYAVADGAERWQGAHDGFIDAALIQREVPDYRERTFYISGPRRW